MLSKKDWQEVEERIKKAVAELRKSLALHEAFLIFAQQQVKYAVEEKKPTNNKKSNEVE